MGIPPVLFVHGFGTSHESTWVNNGWTALLEDAGREVIGVDMLGHGSAEKPTATEDYDKLEDQVFSHFPSNQVDAVIGYFENRDFDKVSAQTIGTVLMQQAKLDDVNVFELLDTLKGLDTLQLSAVVTEVLNYNRSKVSTLGYRLNTSTDKLETRNVLV